MVRWRGVPQLGIWRRLQSPHIWSRMFYERLTEPLHLNIMSLFVAAFGSDRLKIDFDLVPRPEHAYPILRAADEARRRGISRLTLAEFGVAAGAGLFNIHAIASRVTRLTGVEFSIVGFDTGEGLPPALDYRDHPDLYRPGDYPMDWPRLRSQLPDNVELVLGDVADTVPRALEKITEEAPIGFVSMDLDYYSSTVAALRFLLGEPSQYLPSALVYFDDVELPVHNSWCGALLAIREFNDEQPMRKLELNRFRRARRAFKNARWLDQVFTLHVLDHPERTVASRRRERPRERANPYLTGA